MEMSTNTICPWCDTEIVWDEVLGPEEECPYCHNELQQYRSLNVNIEVDEEEEIDKQAAHPHKHDHDEPEEKGWSNFGWGDDAMLFGTADEMKYQEGVDRLLQEQVDVPECPQCREYMLLMGQETIAAEQFTPQVSEVLNSPLVQAPFKLDVYVCSSCFQVAKRLGQAEREGIQQLLSEYSEAQDSTDEY